MNEQQPSYESLLARVKELEVLNKELLEQKALEDRLDYAWAGNLGHWYLNLKTQVVVFNPLKLTSLGYAIDEIETPVRFSFFTSKLHPEDYLKAMNAMRDHMAGKVPVYEIEYRIRHKDGSYKWFHDRGKITQSDEDGSPVLVSGIVFDITKQKENEIFLLAMNQRLEIDSMTDPLTKITNRRAIFKELEAQMVACKLNKQPLSIVMFDIDHFKRINDTKGHVFGDVILQSIAQIIQGRMRGLDTVGRYGGEEFLVILPNTTLDNAALFANSIRETIEKHPFPDGQKVTISGGVSLYQGQDELPFVDSADRRLYQAKSRGRNLIVKE